MGLTGLAEIVNAAGMAMTGEFAYDFQRGCPSRMIKPKTPPMG